MLPSSQLRDVTIRDYLVIVRRRIWIILACFVIITTRATLKTFKKIPLYQANAKIIIERTMPQVAPIQQVYSPIWSDKEYIQSQINIITSRSLAKKVVESLIEAGDTTFAGMKEPAGAFLGGVSVSVVTGTQIINVGYISADSVKAAKFANALANVYIQQDIEMRVEASKYATGWLETQLQEVRSKLRVSEEAINDYLKKNEILTVGDIEQKTLSIMDGLKAEKVKLENEREELSKRYKSKHPRMIALNTRLEAINKSIDDETKTLIELNEKMINYNVLKREVDSNKFLYESLLRRIKETEVSKELQTTNIRIVDLADVPRGPFTPNRKRDITTAAMMGFFLGLGLAFVVEYLDSTVKTAEDIEVHVRLPFLGYVPSARTQAKAIKDIDLMCHKIPNSRFAEAYRSIRTSVIFSSPEDKPLKSILITSSSPQEGKTTVSINLGIVFARAGEKTLIIEADMRRPRIAKSFGLENIQGLSGFLTGTLSLDMAIRQTVIPNLFLMSSGYKPPNPAELLTSAKTQHLLGELKGKFEHIIIDSPPILTVADTAILANIVDGVIDVIRASYLNIEMIIKGRQRLNEVKARIIGVILNNVNVKREDSYYYYHYYYGEEKGKRT